jgi:DNA-directed RNA polymerase subunit omega
MLRPSYTDLIKIVNSEVGPGEDPVVTSRYSIVHATAKRARQIINGSEPHIYTESKKPLSIAVEEFNDSKVKIVQDEEY